MKEPFPEKNRPAKPVPSPAPDPSVELRLPPEREEGSLTSFKQELQLFWRAVSRYKYAILISSLVISVFVYFQCKGQTPIYLATAKILVQLQTRVQAEEIVGMKEGGWVPEEDLQTEKDVIESHVVAERAIQNMGLAQIAPFKDSSNPIGTFVGLVKAQASLKSRTVLITTRFPDPVWAAKITQGVVDAYIEVSDEKEKAWIEKTVDQMREEISRIKDRFANDQRKVKQYETEHPRVISKEALEGNLNRLNQESVEVSAQKLKLRTELEELSAFKRQGSDVRDHPAIAKNAFVEAILNQLQQRQIELTQLLNIYKERFPLVVEKKAEIAQLEENLEQRKGQVVEDLKSQYLLLAAREQELRKSVAAKSKELSSLLEEFSGYESLLGELEISKNLYALIIDRMNKAAIIGRSAQTRVKVLSPATVPRSPTWPKTQQNVFFAFVGSLAGISYLAYLFFLMFKPLESEDEIIQGLKIPVLAQIPYLSHDEKQEAELIVDQEEGFGKDALHVLRASLLANNLHTLLFTSALPTEGKTFLVHNLGVFLAREGWRVLLIGTDFRDPRLKARMKIDVDGQSVEEFIKGHCTAQELIHASSEPRLFYVGSSQALKNSLEVITSPKFHALIQEVSHQFDFVFLDSPPLQLFPDGAMLAREVKDTIFVVRSRKTTLQDLLKSVENIQRTGAHVRGTVLNFKSLEWHNYYYYDYYYAKGGRRGLRQHVVHEAERYAVRVLQGVEKRLHVRFLTRLPVQFTYHSPQGKTHTFSGFVTDFSEGGVLAEYLEKDGPNETDPSSFKILGLKIKLSDQDSISVKGKVVRTSLQEQKVRLGMEFCELTEEDRKKSRQFLESHPFRRWKRGRLQGHLGRLRGVLHLTRGDEKRLGK